MIKNKRQASIVKKEIDELQDITKSINEISKGEKLDVKQQLQLDLFNSKIEELSSELIEYENLISEDLKTLTISNEKIEQAVVSFRIASGLTQKDIADLLGIQEQQIQRYEQHNYLTASFERVIQILGVLDIDVLMKKNFNKKKEESNSNKFLIPEERKISIERTVHFVSSRKQIISWK